MATCRRFLNVAKRNKTFLYTSQKLYSTDIEVRTESNTTDEIIVPYRIQRGPTDILKALASTISKDFTAPKYKYEDDPYFIPASSISKRSFALSKESGKKAARYFLENCHQYFKCNKSAPYIKAFDPPIVYTEENVSSVEQLTECIQSFELNNSVTVYEILKTKGIVVSQEIKQDLLELLCFCNGLEPDNEDYYEERYFKRVSRTVERWNAKGAAERLFDEMEKDSKAYSAMIAGTGKFQDCERAMYLYDEMTSKQLIPTVEAYNSLISLIPVMKERREHSSEYALFLLANMQKDGLLPNLHTMNAVLEVMFVRRFRRTQEQSLNLLAEMKLLNIEPSLGTYSLITSIFCNDSSCELEVLYEIVNIIEGKEFTARHPQDVTFFSTAMEKCYKYALDKNLAYRINKVVEFRNNCKLLGSAFLESIYFKNFFRLLCEFEELDKFMEIYEQYIPNTYTPEPSLMVEIIQKVHFAGNYKYLPRLCTDVFVFNQTERENILNLIMEAAGSMKHDKQIQVELVDVIWKIVEKLNNRLPGKRYDFSWTGFTLGNALNTFVNGGDIEKSWSVLKQFGDDEFMIVGIPEKNTLLKFCELFLQKKEYDKVLFCIKYARKECYPEFGDDFKKLTEDMYIKEELEPKQRVHVNEILRNIAFGSTLSESASDSSNVSASDSLKDSANDSSSDSANDSSSDSSSSDEEDNK